MTEIKMNDPDLREIASALRYLEGREEECSSNRRMWGEIAGAIEEQLPEPAIEEPEQFGSIIRAKSPTCDGDLWTPSPGSGKHYWQSEIGTVEVWPELTDVEVLRVGLGEQDACTCPPHPNPEYSGPGDVSLNCPRHGASADAYRSGFKFGMREMNTQIHGRITGQLSLAITSERKNAYEKAIQAVEELAP